MAPTSMPYVVEIVAFPKLSDNLMSCPLEILGTVVGRTLKDLGRESDRECLVGKGVGVRERGCRTSSAGTVIAPVMFTAVPFAVTVTEC
jgi:hypothetical protein